MVKISREEVRHFARLARIDLTRREETILGEQMPKILDYFSQLDKVDTSKVENLETTKERDVVREDREEKSKDDAILKLAPSRKGRYIKAPRIV